MGLAKLAVVYYLVFFLLEQREGRLNIIEVSLDRMIPFCEYFIIPYLLWFPFIAICVVWFCLKGREEEYTKLLKSLFTGMVVFVLFSLLYPNGQELRPILPGDNIFEQMVMKLYEVDTSTNIFPSLHVFNSIACCIAVFRHIKGGRILLLRMASLVLTFLIILATMFLKQHSVLDVLGAILLNLLCYRYYYDGSFSFQPLEKIRQIFRRGRFRRVRE
ncbi:MAG: phosphatase PAP2 family protein [Lachnospiraceae bacterium]|nr:phosphatase PAP2 family protein [Lachnospiraceae bacterium]